MVAATVAVSSGYFAQLVAERPDIALCRASSAVAKAADAAAEGRGGLCVGRHLVLKMLAAVGPCSQRVLCEELRIDRTVMVGLCDRLESAGLVRRERDAADRRAYAVTITPAGRQALEHAEAAVPGYLDGVFALLSAAERHQLSALLAKALGVDPLDVAG